MTYVLLIYRTSAGDAPAADARAAMAGHRALQAQAAARGELHAVARLDEPARARCVRKVDDAHELTDGPYIETKEWLVGFYLVDCDDEAEALARARQLCADGSHAIEVRPVTWRWKG